MVENRISLLYHTRIEFVLVAMKMCVLLLLHTFGNWPVKKYIFKKYKPINFQSGFWSFFFSKEQGITYRESLWCFFFTLLSCSFHLRNKKNETKFYVYNCRLKDRFKNLSLFLGSQTDISEALMCTRLKWHSNVKFQARRAFIYLYTFNVQTKRNPKRKVKDERWEENHSNHSTVKRIDWN